MTGSKPRCHTVAVLRLFRNAAVAAAVLAAAGLTPACSTAPKEESQAAFIDEANTATQWFESHVPGLDKQIAGSAGYIIYPSVGQWGILFGGGQFGRGMVNDSRGNQIGWGAINVTSIGLQAGVRGFKMLVVIQDNETLNKFKSNQLHGSVTGVAVASTTGASSTAQFRDGIVAYQGASSGLMAGVNIGLDYMRYKPLGDDK
jgi:lipid-binding SYLF domain-containing protein